MEDMFYEGRRAAEGCMDYSAQGTREEPALVPLVWESNPKLEGGLPVCVFITAVPNTKQSEIMTNLYSSSRVCFFVLCNRHWRCTFAGCMPTGPTSKAKVRGKNWMLMLMDRMRSATMRHAICTVSGHMS